MGNYRAFVNDCNAENRGFKCREVCPAGAFLAAPNRKLKGFSQKPDYRVTPRFAYF